MKRPYTKDFKTYDEQLALLASRNLPSYDTDRCRESLRALGYYRLSAYWYPFRLRSEDHVEGVDVPDETIFPGFYLDDIIDAYEIDRTMRHILSKGIDQIEVATRVATAYHLGQQNRFAFEDITLFGDNASAASHWDASVTNFEAFQTMLHNRQVASKETFVQHFESRYDNRLPTWVSIETWDFGTLNTCYQLLRPEDRMKISESWGIPGSRVLGSWLEVLRVVRNMCAHHSRLNRRHFESIPSFPKRTLRFQHVSGMEEAQKHRLYPILVAMNEFLRHTGSPEDFIRDIRGLILSLDTYPAVSAHNYGFPVNWANEEIWKPDRQPN